MAIQTPYSQIATLVIDDMPTQQTTLRGQLQMLHIQKVDVATTAEDAIRMVKAKPYGLVMCDYNLNQKSDGQQLLEYLRDSGLLSPECLFFMVTAENSYAAVASASEHKPDAYLLKPITAGDVEDRLKALLDRRNALLAVNQRLARQDFNGALAECNNLLAKKDRWTMQALQVKGQTLLQMGRHEDAREVYTQVLGLRPNLIWAQLGMAKAHRAAGKFEDAKFLAQSIIASKDGEKNVEAYDLIAQCMEAQGDMQGAMWVMKDSAVVMPSAKRQRLVGESAYRNGDLDTAKECFARLAKATRGSVTSQPQDTLAHAQAMVDCDDPAAALAMLDAGLTQHKNDAQFANVALAIRAQAQAKAGDDVGAKETVAKARATMRRAKADFATVALAKAELMTGNEAAGLKLLETAVSSDHENPRVKQLIGNALRLSGHEDKMQQIVDGAVGEINTRVTAAKSQFRDSRIDEALAAIETALKDFPDNTGVLLQAAQMNCMALRLKKQLNAAIAERVRLYLTRLDALMPGNDRVALMHRYYRETVASLSGATAQAA
ncbi:MAG: response regulator [Rubrivivax sp.]|nr:response regulator [Rubrivivax sp.]